MIDYIPTQFVTLPDGTKAIRYAEYNADGSFKEYRYFKESGEPEGDPTVIAKLSLFTDATAAAYGLTGNDALPTKAFDALSFASQYVWGLNGVLLYSPDPDAYPTDGSGGYQYFGKYKEILPARDSIIGSYTGNSTATGAGTERNISLGFAPSAVMLINTTVATNSYVATGVAYAVQGKGYNISGSGAMTVLELTSEGFTVANHGTAVRWNYSNARYDYIAWR